MKSAEVNCVVAPLETKPRIVVSASPQCPRPRRGRVTVIAGAVADGLALKESTVRLSAVSESEVKGCAAKGSPPDPHDEAIFHDLIASVAYELWTMHGGNDVLNWLEAERLLRRLLASRPPESPPGEISAAHSAAVKASVWGAAGFAHAVAAQGKPALNGHAHSCEAMGGGSR